MAGLGDLKLGPLNLVLGRGSLGGLGILRLEGGSCLLTLRSFGGSGGGLGAGRWELFAYSRLIWGSLVGLEGS